VLFAVAEYDPPVSHRQAELLGDHVLEFVRIHAPARAAAASA
jgi:hypothetical protein